jgi:hypothetical protein
MTLEEKLFHIAGLVEQNTKNIADLGLKVDALSEEVRRTHD